MSRLLFLFVTFSLRFTLFTVLFHMSGCSNMISLRLKEQSTPFERISFVFYRRSPNSESSSFCLHPSNVRREGRVKLWEIIEDNRIMLSDTIPKPRLDSSVHYPNLYVKNLLIETNEKYSGKGIKNCKEGLNTIINFFYEKQSNRR